MRLIELFESYSELRSSTLPDTLIYKGMPSSNPYAWYRFGVAMANHKEGDPKNVSTNYATVVLYAPEEEEKVRAAEREFGQSPTRVADKKSREPKETNTVSPVSKPKKNKYGV